LPFNQPLNELGLVHGRRLPKVYISSALYQIGGRASLGLVFATYIAIMVQKKKAGEACLPSKPLGLTCIRLDECNGLDS